MNAIKIALTELYGLFVDDGSLAIGTLAWVAFILLLLPRLHLPHIAQGIVFFAGLAAILVENVYRSARK